MKHKDQILKLKEKYPKHYCIKIKRDFPEIFNEIEKFHKNYFKEGFPNSQKIFNYCYNVTQIPRCEVTGEKVQFWNTKWRYRTYSKRGVLTKKDIEKRAQKRIGKKFIKKRKNVKIEQTHNFDYISYFFSCIFSKKTRLTDTIQRLNHRFPYLKEHIEHLYPYNNVPLKVKIYCLKHGLSKIPVCPYSETDICTFISETKGFLPYNKKNVHIHKKNQYEKKIKNGDTYTEKEIKDKLNTYLKQLSSFQNLKQSLVKIDPGIVKSVESIYKNGTFSEKCYTILNGKPEPHKKIKHFYGGFMKGWEERFKHSNDSKGEEELRDFVNSLGFKTVKYRDSYEIDIFIPEKGIGIEYNGEYYHSNIFKAKNFHKRKTNFFQQKGIDIIHVFENEWYSKQPIIKSVLKAKLQKCEKKMFARKLILKEVDKDRGRLFLDQNHIQGRDRGWLYLGLYDESGLVGLMSFCKRKITGKTTYELSRFCTVLDTVIIGGASRLFKHFLNNYWSEEPITTYCDRRFSPGSTFYDQLGFTFSHESDPNYWYFKPAPIPYLRVFHRASFMKHTLIKKLEKFDPNLTEKENMLANGYLFFHDCGNKVYEYEKSN